MTDTQLTTMSAADVIAQLNQQDEGKFAGDKALAVVTKVGDYLPYIQVMGSQSELVKEGKAQMGHLVLRKGKSVVDLGTSAVTLLLAWRSKAMQYQPTMLTVYDSDSPMFKELAAKAEIQNSGCQNGPEFLVWLPDHKELATFYFGNKSGRMEGPNIIAAMRSGNRKARFNCELVRSKTNTKQSWHVAKRYEYELEINSMPDMESMNEWIEKFKNPKEDKREPAEKASEGSDRG